MSLMFLVIFRRWISGGMGVLYLWQCLYIVSMFSVCSLRAARLVGGILVCALMGCVLIILMMFCGMGC
jgi:hypothetical protein